MKTPMVSSATSFQRLQTSLQSPMPRLPRSNVYSTQDPANPSASVHRKRFFTPSLTLKFLCVGYLNRGFTGPERIWNIFGPPDLGAISFETLKRRSTPNDA